MTAGAPPVVAIALLSAGALATEVLYVRLLSIVQWHHFAAMVVSLALFGYGASGSLLAVATAALRRFDHFFAVNALLFGAVAPLAFLAAQALTFNPLELPWDAAQLGRLAATYLVLSVPFLLAANAIGSALMRGPRIAALYAGDLLGAGGGAVAVIGLLMLLEPLAALWTAAALGPLAAAVVWWRGSRRALGAAAGALAVLLPLGQRLAPLTPSPYKDLSQTLAVAGAEVVARRASPTGLLTVVGNRRIPLRDAPGLSLLSPRGPGEQLALFVDGNAAGTLLGAGDDGHLDWLTSALPFHLATRPRVLVLAGGDTAVRQALRHNAAAVETAETQPGLPALLRGPLGGFTGHVYDDPRVTIRLTEPRALLESAEGGAWDVIVLTVPGGFGMAAAGTGAVGEDHLFTVEAFRRMLARLRPGGTVAVNGWLLLPPRQALKAVAVAAAALRAEGESAPGGRVVLIRSWRTTAMLVRGGGRFTAGEIATIRDFCHGRGFDLVWSPGATAEESERYALLGDTSFHEAAAALLGPDAEAFRARYAYDIAPPGDDRPFFHSYIRWPLLKDAWRLRDQGGLGLADWGYPVLLAATVQAGAIGALLIPLPLVLARRRPSASPARRWRTLGYFAALGLGFMMVEMTLLQRFILLLGTPALSAAVVLGGFLTLAGLGSLLAPRFAPGGDPRPAIGLVVVAAVGLSLALPVLLPLLAGLPLAVRLLAVPLLLLPLALPMGMPFPLGLTALGASSPDLIPWAWAVNGCASVLGALLASLLAVDLGFAAVTQVGAALYLFAGWVRGPANLG